MYTDKITQTEVDNVLAKHKAWLRDAPDGVRAVLRGADLRGADLLECSLSESDLRGCNLSESDLSGADLSGADLRGADLRGADLRGAVLRGADLRECSLNGADLSESIGVRWADCSWFGHGEIGRRLLAVDLAENGGDGVRYFCGCFMGSANDLTAYIMSGGSALRASRFRAFRFVAESLGLEFAAGKVMPA